MYNPANDYNYSDVRKVALIELSNNWLNASSEGEQDKILKELQGLREYMASKPGKAFDWFFNSSFYKGCQTINEFAYQYQMATMGHEVLPVEPVMAEKAVAEEIKVFDKSKMIYLEVNLQTFAQYLGKWNKGSFKSVINSAEYHYNRHGAEVGATSIEQYIRKAEGFMENLRGATKSPVSGSVEGVVRYKKNGKYIDLAPDNTIVSFGKQ